MLIRTKILATIGPASMDGKVLRCLFDAGCDACRINFSHGSDEQHGEILSTIRSVEADIDKPIAVVADLCGPKIRVGPMAGGSCLLPEGQDVIIQRFPLEGTPNRISTTLGELIDDVKPGQKLRLDDGKLVLEVTETRPPHEVTCKVLVGGVLASGKGVNLPETDLNLSALTEKDRCDVAWICKNDIDYVSLSFVQRAEDILQLRELLQSGGSEARIIAKIEKPQALKNFDEILAASDAIMVARGDLGVELDAPDVPVAQKRMARACQQAGKPCIIATQMLESMIECPMPTRAEISDIANAVLDHADVVMLSGETAAGKYPVQAVDMMNRTVEAIQAFHDETAQPVLVTSETSPTTAAIARALREIISTEDIAGTVVFTLTGRSARMVSKNRPNCPIAAFSPSPRVVRQMALYYGVMPFQATEPHHTRDVLAMVDRKAIELGFQPGQRVVVITGRPLDKPGCTNTLVVHQIGAPV